MKNFSTSRCITAASTYLFTMTLLLCLFSRNLGEYFFDACVLFILALTATRKTPWRFKTLVYDTGFNWLLWTFCVWILFTLLINPPLSVEAFRPAAELIWIPFIFIFARVLNLWNPSRSIVAFISLFIVVSMAALTYHFLVYPEFGMHWEFPNRLRGTFTNVNFLAHAYFLVLLLFWGLVISFWQSKEKLLGTLAATTALSVLVVLIFTFTRSIWISLVLTCPITIFLVNRKAAVGLLLSLVTLVTALYVTDFGGMKERFNQAIAPHQTQDLARIILWRTNFKIFLDNPVAGVGYYKNTLNIADYFQKYGENDPNHLEYTHAHNEVLSFLAGTGIVGAILYLALFVMFFCLGIKTLNKIPFSNSIHRGFLLGAISVQPGFLIAGFADNNFEIHSARNWLAISWAIIIWLACENKIKLEFFKPSKTGVLNKEIA